MEVAQSSMAGIALLSIRAPGSIVGSKLTCSAVPLRSAGVVTWTVVVGGGVRSTACVEQRVFGAVDAPGEAGVAAGTQASPCTPRAAPFT